MDPLTDIYKMLNTEAQAEGLPKGSRLTKDSGEDLDLVPVIGDIKGGLESINHLNKGDFGLATLAGIGAIPLVGDALKPVAKAGLDAFHSTKNLKKIIETNIFNPVPEGVGQDIGIHVGLSPYTTNNVVLNKEYERILEAAGNKKQIEKHYSGSASIPLQLDPNLKPLRVPDVGAFKYPEEWIGHLEIWDPEFPMPDEVKRDLIKTAQKAIEDIPDRFRKARDVKAIKYWDTKEGRGNWINRLRKTLNKHGYDSLIYTNKTEGWADDAVKAGDINPITKKPITEPEDSLMLLYPRQVKYKGSSKKDWTKLEADKKKGGSVVERDPYNRKPRII